MSRFPRLTSVSRRGIHLVRERFDKVHNKIPSWRWNGDVDGDWSRQRAIMSFLRQFLGKSRKSATMEQKWRGWRADIFSRVEKRKTHVNIRSKKKKKKREKLKRKEIFFSNREKKSISWMCLSRGNGIPYRNLSIV